MLEGPPSHRKDDNRSAGEGTVAYLDQALWRQLAEAETSQDFCYSWLSLQSRMIEGVVAGMAVLGPAGTGPFAPVAFWPGGKTPPEHLTGVSERALAERKGVVQRDDREGSTDPSEKRNIHVAYPVRGDDSLHGVVAFEIAPRPPEQLQSVMRQLQWGVAWLDRWALVGELKSDLAARQGIISALDLAAVTLQADRFDAASSSFATELASRFDCDRVSIGFLKGNRVKVRALSHSAQFKKKMNLILAIGSAMEESLDQQVPLVYPETSEKSNRVLRAHAELATEHGNGSVCTIPFIDGKGDGYGAMTLERSAERAFDPETVKLCDGVAALAGPILEEKRKNDRFLIVKAWESGRRQAEKLVGKGHLIVKSIVAALVILVLFFSFAKGEYRVTAKSTLEGSVQRAVTAPQDGYVLEADVRAGDTVRAGEVMCRLDDRDLRLQRLRAGSQKGQFLRQYREAMAKGDRANMKILGEQVKQAEAQIALLDDQLARTRMIAPFDGLVVSGDLSQSLGSPVQEGQLLFEVAPLDNYRLKLQVDEREIDQIKVGQTGVLVLNALPETRFSITVSKITPVSTPIEGHNRFTVEAGLDTVSDRLRPGMEGYGKVGIGRRKLIWIWTNDLIDWVRLWVWSWLP